MHALVRSRYFWLEREFRDIYLVAIQFYYSNRTALVMHFNQTKVQILSPCLSLSVSAQGRFLHSQRRPHSDFATAGRHHPNVLPGGEVQHPRYTVVARALSSRQSSSLCDPYTGYDNKAATRMRGCVGGRGYSVLGKLVLLSVLSR